ncbi:Nif3-like dinuclear metal center hexameric protein [Amantichitinum ursilacus]|uniref:Putative GTP cyclohydrolase 1 type 2 n=1 Tax=Amantichitinum ursilacus TaxID=857265 RepID=A0A0N0GPU4_9NEIS|nr:Nif3-like dinuclear metal center hexameric protein [Amantichitinum ursilacus]KPC54052.1 putative GTP cyclohydrolase 1 type 2 [Amantichitinum ursilacus]
MSVSRQELENYIGQYLRVSLFRDYCPNGIQVEGRASIQRIATAVTASLAAIEAAHAIGADALLVHHGYFWKGEAAPITGTKKARIARLISTDINLFAYHLPLDAHPDVGNNATLGQILGARTVGQFGEQNLAWIGEFDAPVTLRQLGARLHSMLEREPLLIGDLDKPLRRIGWCTGGAQSFFHEAATLDIDCFVTGEASEFVTHTARESGVAFVAAGHHATERGGVRALGAHLAEHFGLDVTHLDIPNPV